MVFIAVFELGVAHANDAAAVLADVEPKLGTNTRELGSFHLEQQDLFVPQPVVERGDLVLDQRLDHRNVVNQIQHQRF